MLFVSACLTCAELASQECKCGIDEQGMEHLQSNEDEGA